MMMRSLSIALGGGNKMTKSEILDLFYRTIDWKECYYEAQSLMEHRTK